MDALLPLYSLGEETKNKHALKICRRIMKDATWINIHTLLVRKIKKMDTFKEGGGSRNCYIEIVVLSTARAEGGRDEDDRGVWSEMAARWVRVQRIPRATDGGRTFTRMETLNIIIKF